MIYKLVNSKKIIGRIFEDHNVDYEGFISRVPNFIFQGLRQLNIYTGFSNETVDGSVVDYKCAVPDACKILLGVSYMGYRLPRIGKINEGVSDDMPDLIHPQYKYELDNNGYIITTFQEGDIKFYIKKLPLEKDTETQLYFPMIPDNEEVYEALVWFVLMKLLYRGHKIGELSLKVPNEFLNPAVAWNKHKKIARNSATRLDIDERDKISRMIRTMLVDYNYYTQVGFNPTNRS